MTANLTDRQYAQLATVEAGGTIHHMSRKKLVALGLLDEAGLTGLGSATLALHRRLDKVEPVAAKPAKKAADLNRCACSDDCDATSRNVFAPGHDARWAGIAGREIAAEADDTYTSLVVRERVEQIAPVGTSEALIAKAARVARNAIDKARAKRAKQAAKAA